MPRDAVEWCPERRAVVEVVTGSVVPTPDAWSALVLAELSATSRNIAASENRRNQLLRAGVLGGMSLRRLGEAADVSHEHVRRLARPDLPRSS